MILSLVGITVLLLLAFVGVPLGFAMVAVGFVGFGLARGWGPALETVGQMVLDLSMSSEFASLPLFVLMGVFIHRSGISDDLYAAAHSWLGHLRGGLAMATVLACGGLASVSGSSLATTATMARVAMPSMKRYGYADSIAAGSIAAGGTLGLLIPPSTSLLIYGILTNQHIGKLFIAGIVPGVVLVMLFMVAVAITTRLRPGLVQVAPRAAIAASLAATLKVWPVLVLFLSILGGIYFGLFTASESGGIGAAGALGFALYRRRLDWRGFLDALVESGRTTVMLFTVGFGALIINNFVNVAGLTTELVAWISALDVAPVTVVLVLVVIYLVLGMVFDGIALILLTVPVFFPVVAAIGYDLIWFGVFVTIMAEIAVITPPVGMNVFVLRALYPSLLLRDIFNGIWPFFFADLVLLSLVIAFPAAVLWLPGFMK
jgi:C4-dicarboxylate transporter DctM subunit